MCPYAVLGLLFRLEMLKYKCYVTKKSIDVYKNIVQVINSVSNIMEHWTDDVHWYISIPYIGT